MAIQRINLIDRTEFRFAHKLREQGPAAVIPVAQQRQRVGFNCARIFATAKLLFDFDPAQTGLTKHQDVILAASDILAVHGSYTNLVVFADARVFGWSKKQQLDFWRAMGEVCQMRPGQFLLSAVNEENNGGANGVNHLEALNDLQPIPGVLCSRGSNDGATDLPPLPVMQWGETHTNAQSEWWRKDHNAMADVANVYDTIAGVTEKPRPDQDPEIHHHEDAAAVGALLCGFSTFHFDEGRYSNLVVEGGLTWQCMTAFVRGARSVPLEFQAGAYYRPVDPAYLRVYGRRLSDGRSKEVTVRF